MTKFQARVIAVATGCVLSSGMAARASASEAFCSQAEGARIPARSATAHGGSELAGELDGIDEEARERLIRGELLAGNIPQFLRRLHPVELRRELPNGETTRVTVCVMADYLALGSDSDYLLVPMRLETALAVAERFGFTLPTPTLVDAIYAQSAVHLNPQPLPAGPAMRSTAYYRSHDALVRAQRLRIDAEPGALISGHKKDLVLTNRLWNNLERVAIYGWHTRDGRPIQPLSTVHGWHYVDYSHGVRLVSTRILVNDSPESLFAILQDALAARILSGEGAISRVSDLIGRLTAPHPRPVASLTSSSLLGADAWFVPGAGMAQRMLETADTGLRSK
jgi:hypothetical protein